MDLLLPLLRRHEGHHEVKTDRYLAFGYYSESLDDKQKHQRREYLDWYGFVAQWSVLVIFALFQLGFAISWLIKSGLKYDQPKSPSFAKSTNDRLGWLRKAHGGCNRIIWWMRKDAIRGWAWGTRGEWIGAAAWTIWLLYLCVAHTRKDYLHLTKRFGQVGASQLPIHYLLAMRAPYNPVQFLTRLSHEQIKNFHQILGRIVFLLFLLHTAFYLNFFVLSGLVTKRIKDWDVIWGLTSIILFSLISTTALGFVRRRNYRVFYISHIAIANLIIVPLLLHVSYLRVYVYEIIAVEALHVIFRASRLKTYQGTIKLLPGTSLVQVRIPLPSDSKALTWKPGQHVYLSKPESQGRTPKWYDRMLAVNKTNPFTIASLPSKDKELLLIARVLNGNTKYLAELARSLAQGGSSVPMLPTAGGDIPILPLTLEGPYGGSTRLPDLSDYDKVLLVAGGVGATFVMPIYRSIRELHSLTPTSTQIRFIWAVQKLVETQWAFPASTQSIGKQVDVDDDNGGGDEDDGGAGVQANGDGLLHGPSNVEVYLTRPSGPNLQVSANTSGSAFAVDSDDEDGEAMEMQENVQLLSMEEQMEKTRKGMVIKSGRPDLRGIVDDVFSKGVRSAVICCGPKRMTDDLRTSVEVWVKKGHDVFWYDETFGW